jgi:two-component system LytT family sensor kinase
MRDFNPSSKWRAAILFVAGWTVIGVVFATVAYAGAFHEGNRRLLYSDAIRYNLIYFYVWAGLALLLVHFSRRFPVELRPLRSRNLLLHIPAILVFAAVHQTIHLAIYFSLVPGARGRFASVPAAFRASFGYGFYIDLIIALLIVIATHALLYYRRLKASELTQATLKTQLVEAQLKALKMQLHPHFLFNTLHSISSLVLEDPARANVMIARLGDFLRLTLEHSDEQTVTLKEEIEFLRCYLDIEQARFGERLSVRFNIDPPTWSASVPHLILQPIVENAIQYAIAPRAAPGRIEIEANRAGSVLRLAVKDDGGGMRAGDEASERRGVGLSNVRARLQQMYGCHAALETLNGAEGGLTVTLQMPWSSPDD